MSNRIQFGAKTIAMLTVASTILSLSGFALVTPVAAVAPADYGLHEGDTISANATVGDPDIYIVNDWGYKRLFVNPAIFTLYGHLSWAGVKAVSAATRDAFVTSGLFRNCETNDQKVYGLDVISEDTANLRWVNISGADAVAQDPNFFKKVFCINTAEQHLYGTGPDFTSLSQVPAYSRGATGTGGVTAGTFSVSLASDNPAAGTIIGGQAAADLAHFTFTGSGAVTSVVLNRLGVSSDTTLSNVYLYQGAKRLTDSATVSQGKITFSDSNGLFTVNGSATISVKADILSTASGVTVGVQLASVNGVATSVSGNLMYVAALPGDFATVAVGAPTPSAATTLDPQTDYNMWQSTVTVGNHDVWLKSLQLRVIGSVLPGDLRNFRLYVDGTMVGGAVSQVDSNGYLVFDLGAGVRLTTGSRIFKLLGDVIGGSNRNFVISLRQAPDISVVDSQYNQPVLATGTFPATAPTQTLGTEVQAINQGTLTITKATDSPSGDVIKDSTGVSLVKYQFQAFGESLKIESLRATFTAGGNDAATSLTSLRNGAIYVDGAQVGSIQNLCSDAVSTVASCSAGTAYTQFNLGSSLIVNPGTPRTVEVRSDIYDNTGTNNALAGATIVGKIIAGSTNVQRLTSLNYFSNALPTAGSTLTVKVGSFSAAKYTGYANQSVVVPQSQFKIGAYTLTSATSEDVNVNTINVDVPDTVNTGNFQAVDLQNMYLKVWNDSGALVLQTSPKSTISGTASNSYSVNFTIPKTKTYRVEVYADVLATATSGTLVTNVDATGITANSAQSATAAQVTGQSITSTTGSLTLNNGSVPPARLVNGPQTGVTAYVFTLRPQYDNFTLDDAVFKLSSTLASSSGAITTAYLKDGNTVIATAPVVVNASSTSISFTGMNHAMALADGVKTFTVSFDAASVGVSGNDTAGNVTVQLSHLKYRNGSGTITTSVVSPATYTGNANIVVAAYPSFSNVALPSTVLAPGTQTLFKTNVTSNGGTVAWHRVVFTITTTSGPTIAHNSFKLYENGADITTQASQSTGLGGTANYATVSKDFAVAGASSGQVVFYFPTERYISGTTTLELRGTVGGTTSAGNSITTQIANPNGSTAPTTDDAATLAGTFASDINPSFLWSDSSAPTHSDTTDDWFGDGLVTGLAQSESLYQ